MSVKFLYEYEGDSFFGKVYRPVAKVSFQSVKMKIWTDVWMVVDTGADFSILPYYVAKELFIDLEKDCSKDTTSGVGGTQSIYLCKSKIHVRIGNIERNIPIAFFDSNDIPALLGRVGFLETFNTEFLKSHTVVFHG